MSLYWPDLTLPGRNQVLNDQQPNVPPLISFAETRQGQASLREVASGVRRVAISRNAAFDDLSAQGSISKYGTDGDLGRSWQELDNRDTFDWRVGLSYTHVFGTEANRVNYQQTLLVLDQIRLRARMVERDWHARALLLRDTFTDALARVIEQQRLVIAERNELTLAKAQVEAGRTTTRDLVDAQQRVSNAILALYQANLDVLRSDLNLRLHENRLLSLLP
jgi:outer membrane protein TolC